MRNVLSTLTLRLAPVIIRVWVVLWVLFVPLFHIHPELAESSDHAGGMRSGTVHTVFSRDLDGEFTPHEAASHPAADKSAHLSHTWFEHAELGFSLITDSHHRTDLKPLLIQTMVLPIGETAIVLSSRQIADRLAAVPPATLFVHEFAARAPPLLLL